MIRVRFRKWVRRRTAYLVGAQVAYSFVVELSDLSFLC